MLSKIEMALVAGTFVCVAAVMSLPYLMLSYAAHKQFGDDYLYILPQYDVPAHRITPDYLCTPDILQLDYDDFVLSAANLYLNVYRPLYISIHAAVYKDQEIYTWTFRNLKFEKLETYRDPRNFGPYRMCRRKT